MSEEDYTQRIKAEAKQLQLIEELIEKGGYCWLCGYFEDPLLIQNHPLPTENHHTAGRNNDPTRIPVCRNCHGRLTRKQRSWPENWFGEDNPVLVRLALKLRGWAEIDQLRSRDLREMSDELLRLSKRAAS